MTGKPQWAVEGVGWPNREASRFVVAAGLRWHVQVMGEGPALLLLHGVGAATHSWRALIPRLAERFTVVVPDLPGHGFTDTPPGTGALSLPEVARRVAALLTTLEVEPAGVVGHSAGAAVALRLVLDGSITPSAVVAINGALLPFPGVTAPLFQGVARLLATGPFAAQLFAMQANDPARVARLMRGTGSTIDAEGVGLYARLFRTPGHVAGTLRMMADWDLAPLSRDYGRLDVPLTLVVGERDAAVPPSVAERVRALAPGAAVVRLADLGHLAHEERPELVAPVIERALRS